MKKTRKLRKLVLTICCMLAIVAISVGATLAYLTDTEAVTNTFTVGNVDIELNETGAVVSADGTKGKAYHLLPGQTYTKDPTVTVKAKSEPSYVRMLVTVEDYSDLFNGARKHESEIEDMTVQISNRSPLNPEVFMNISDEWILTSAKIAANPMTSCTYEYRYEKTTEKKEQNDVLPSLFTQFTIPGCFTNDDLLALSEGYTWLTDAQRNPYVGEGSTPGFCYPFQITVKAEAIQAEGFANADAAWEAFDAQNN